MMSADRLLPGGLALPLVLILLLTPAFTIGGEEDDLAYKTLVQRIKGGDFTVDFRELRMLCMKSSICEPRGTKADLGALNNMEKKHEMDKAVEITEKLIDEGLLYVTIKCSPRQGPFGNRFSRRGQEGPGVSYSFDCPVCFSLQEELYLAVDRLAIASSLLSDVPGSGNAKFERLLAASTAAKAECVRIRAEKQKHEATHFPDSQAI